ncbi:MAG: holo-ACP synthase [Acidobacteriota bacterium]|nr:holo-ACP synthase [Acidobacteriota bacterium]
MNLPIIAYIDGGSRGNPGSAGYGVSIETREGTIVEELTGAIGVATNNNAEYRGLIAALEYCVKHQYRDVIIRSDSQLLIRQMSGKYKVRQPQLRKLHIQAKTLESQLTNVQYEHVPREQNQRADKLANVAMDKATNSERKSKPVHSSAKPSPPAVLSVGIDVEDVSRVEGLIRRYGDRFTTRIFTNGEIDYCQRRRFSAQHFTGRFSAKEAAMKALGTGRGNGVLWKDIEVIRTVPGPPKLKFTGGAKIRADKLGVTGALLSITHTATIGMAHVSLLHCP